MASLTKEEHIGLLKECGMCTKKWTLSKRKEYAKKKSELLKKKNEKKSLLNLGGNK